MEDGVRGEPAEKRVEGEGRIKGQAEWKVNYWKGEEGDTSVQLFFFVRSVYTYSPHPRTERYLCILAPSLDWTISLYTRPILRLNDTLIYSPHPRTERCPYILAPS